MNPVNLEGIQSYVENAPDEIPCRISGFEVTGHFSLDPFKVLGVCEQSNVRRSSLDNLCGQNGERT